MEREDGILLRAEERMINWYPGHMAKSRRLLQEQLSRVDAVIELCDARVPMAGRNPDLSQMLGEKKRLLVLNKADLADERMTRAWTAYYRSRGIACRAFDSTRSRAKEITDSLAALTREMVERLAARGVHKTVRAMVVGIPNVGKSTFVNRLNGNAIARTGDRPGVTRSNQWVKITPYLELLDTPGLLWPKMENQEEAIRLAYIGSINDQVLDTQLLAARLLCTLRELCPQAVSERFHIRDLEGDGVALLEAAARGRGWLLPGGIADTERGASVILDEFRSGKLGRLTLEKVPEEEKA